jgi:2,4-dienoyl-CoA reductase-like NADH-dependent reductase (Old Yellow Enzyme family)
MERTISESITLPCGLTLPNRLVKAATAEQLALKGDHQPNVRHVELYGKWAEGGWGLIIAGRVADLQKADVG